MYGYSSVWLNRVTSFSRSRTMLSTGVLHSTRFTVKDFGEIPRE